jgi:hypothetical protein
MMDKLTFRAMLLGGVCMLPLGAWAADLGAAPAAPPQTASENEIDFGLGGVWGTNTGQFGRYNGFTEEGLDGLFSFSSVTRKDTQYYIFEGSNINFQFGDNLGRAPYPCTTANLGQCQTGSFKDNAYTNGTANDLGPNAEAKFEVGDQGKWGVIGYYDAISYTGNIIDSFWTMNGNHGTVNPMTGLTEPWGGAGLTGAPPGTTAGAITPAQLASGEQPYQMGTRRDIVGLTGTYKWGDWTITGAFRQEHKEGSVEESVSMGPLGDGYGGAAFALPVDYDTQRYDVSAAYSTPQLQAVFAYFLSNFTDHTNGAFLPYPAAGSSSPYQMTALYATPPSNLAQYVTAMVAYNILPNTKVNVNARYGVETQNDAYPSNSGDPALIPGGPPGGLPGLTDFNGVWLGTSAASPNIVAQVYQGNVGVTSTPIANLSVGAKYAIDGRNVSIDQSGAVYGGFIGGYYADSAFLSGPVGFVVPQDWLKQKVTADLDYRILPQSNTRVFANYEFDDTDRSNAQVGRSWTNTGTLGVSSMLGSNLQGRVSGTLGERSGVVHFWGAFTNLDDAPGSGMYSGDPSIAYYQAPYTMEAANARLDYAPPGPFSGGLSFKFENDNYHDGNATEPNGFVANLLNESEGIKQNQNITAGIDGNYRATDSVDLHAFYSFEQIYFDNVGNGACSTTTSAITTACGGTGTAASATNLGLFYNKYTNDVQTVGASVEWKPTDRLKLSIEEIFAYGDVTFAEGNGVFVALPTQSFQNVSSYPAEPSYMNQLTAKLKYQLTDNVELGLGAGWSMFQIKNWQDTSCAVMGTGPTTPGVCGAGSATPGALALLTPGYLSPNYNVGLVMASLKVKW